MTEGRKRRCQHCWNMVPWKETTVITSNKKVMEKWIEVLGEGFGEKMERLGSRRGYICRSHFTTEVANGRRSMFALPTLCDTVESLPVDSREELDDGFEIVVDETDSDRTRGEGGDDVGEPEEEDNSVDGSGNDGSDCSYEPGSEDWSDCDEEDEDDKATGGIEYAFVDVTCMIDALKFCRRCCSEAVEVSVEKPSGYAISISLDCLNCCHAWKWSSSRKINESKEFMVNRDFVSSSICTGSSYSKLASLFQTIRAPYLRKTAYYDLVQNHVRPVVQALHDETQEKVKEIVIQNCQENQKGLDLAGDAQFDSPGHMAEHSRYALLDVDTNFVLETQLLKKSSKTESSKSLEPKSLDLALTKLQNALRAPDGSSLVEIDTITTDRDPSVGKLLTNKYPSIRQYFDGWHFVRNVKKIIWKKINQVQMQPVKNWIRPLTNHLHHAFASSGGDGQLTVEKFISFFCHCQNVHDNFTQINGFHFTRFTQCDHDELTHDRDDYIDVNNPKHSKALELLWDMIVSDKRLKDLEKVSPFFNTSEVESFNSLSTTYHPKSFFFHKNFPLRVQLTVLHWNHLKMEWINKERNSIGVKAYYNKSNKETVWKYRKSPGSHSWRRVILERIQKKEDIHKRNDEMREDVDALCGEIARFNNHYKEHLLLHLDPICRNTAWGQFAQSQEPKHNFKKGRGTSEVQRRNIGQRRSARLQHNRGSFF